MSEFDILLEVVWHSALLELMCQTRRHVEAPVQRVEPGFSNCASELLIDLIN